MKYLGLIGIWVATAVAVSIGVYYTKDVNCFWAFAAPLGGSVIVPLFDI